MAADDREFHRRAQQVLIDALDHDQDPEARLDWARHRCGADKTLWAEVESLLRIAAEWGDNTTRSALHVFRRTATPPPERIEDFELVRRLGAGGMGIVGLYRQREPLDRLVAIKLVQTQSDVARRLFLAERGILARLQHPAIAQVYEAGTAPDGRPFMVIEYVEGAQLSEACDERRLTLRDRISLLATVARAIDHANQRAVLHLDLKPANVLVMDQDGELRPKVIDFGIGQRLDDETSIVQELGQRIATPAWASPEQLEPPGASEVSVRTDIYGLGLLLHHQLTGRLPSTPSSTPSSSSSSSISTLPRAKNETVQPPSETLADLQPSELEAVASHRSEAAGRLRRSIRGDLDSIAQRALEPDPDRRYPTALAFARDLESWLAGEPISARPLGISQRLLRSAVRNPLPTLLAVGLLLSLIAGLLLYRDQAHRAREAAETATRQATRAESVTRILVELFQQADPWRTSSEESAQGLVTRASERLLADQSLSDDVRGYLLSALAEVNMGLGSFDIARDLIDETQALTGGRPAEPSDLETLIRAANLDHYQGNLDAAETQYREALSAAETMLPEDHQLIARAVNDLAYLQRTRGQLDEAQAGFRRALSILPPESAAAGRVQDNLAGVFYAKGEYSSARETYRHALAIKRRALPPIHPDFAATLSNLALVYAKLGELDEAESVYLESLEIKMAHLEPDHYEIGVSWASLGNLYKVQGRLDEASRAFETASRLYRSRLGSRDYRLGLVALGQGDVAVARGRPDEALEHYRRAREILDASVGPRHRFVAECLGDTGFAYFLAGRYGEALEALETSRQFWREAFDEGRSPRAASGLALTLLDLASLHDAMGQPETAQGVRERALEIVPSDDALANREIRARLAFQLGGADGPSLLRQVLATGARGPRLLRDASAAGFPTGSGDPPSSDQSG